MLCNKETQIFIGFHNTSHFLSVLHENLGSVAAPLAPACFGSVQCWVFHSRFRYSWRSSQSFCSCCLHGLEQEVGSQQRLLTCIQILRGLQNLSDQDKYHSIHIHTKYIFIQKSILNDMSKILNKIESDPELSWSDLTPPCPEPSAGRNQFGSAKLSRCI